MQISWVGKFMSADKKKNKPAAVQTIRGIVIEKTYARGTKSQHEALYIQTSEHEYVLRRINANPFQDEELQEYKGKEVTATGVLDKNTFLAREIKPC